MTKRAVVVGGGIVGGMQALLLARSGYRVIVVDAARLTSRVYKEDALAVRTVAMSCRSQQLLESVGLWAARTGCPINTVHVSDKGRFGSVRFDRYDYSVPALGFVVRNLELENYFYQLIDADPAIELLRPATAELFSVNDKHAEIDIVFEDKRQREVADLLVAADGTGSDLRAKLGIEVETIDYQQHALVANIQCQREHKNIAFERFTASGPLAMLPLDERVVAIVCTVDSKDAETYSQCSDESLLLELQRRFGGRLGRFEKIGRRAVFPLSLVRARQQVSGCAVLLGNASVTLHPVAGQGFNLAVRDGFELASRLGGANPVAATLQDFTAARRRDQQFVIRQTDALAKWFRAGPAAGILPLNPVKTASMLMLDAVPPLRNWFGRRSAGLDIPVSHLSAHDDQMTGEIK